VSAPPIPCVFQEGAFQPLPNYRKVANASYGEGEVVSLVAHEDRSLASHGHYFASVSEAWKNLPEEQTERFPTADHLRKWALIKTGYRDERTFVCSSKAEATRVAAFVKPLDPYAVIIPRGAVVTAYTAKSQSMRAMGKKEFQESKEAVLGVLAEILHIEPSALGSRAA